MNKTILCVIALLIAFAVSACADTTVITRTGKGSALTWGEMDTNLTTLATAIDTKAPITSPAFLTGISTPAITLNGTAILAATAGKFAVLQSDGTNWQIMMAN